MNLYGISNILTGITSLALAIFVYMKGHKQRLSRIWSGLAVSTAVYGFGAYMVTSAQNASEAFFWWQVSYLGIILIPFFFICFVYEFLGIKHPLFVKFAVLLTILFLIFDIFFKKLFINNCTLYFTEIKWVKPIYFVYPPGPLLRIFIIFTFFGWAAYGNLELIKNYKKISGLKRIQAKYFLSAAILAFIGGGASFLPCFGISFYPIFNFTVPLYFFMMSYAILRYRLMDITIAITRTGIFVAVYTLLLGVPFAIAVRLKSWLIGIFGLNWWVLPSVSMAISATVGPFIYIYFDRKAEEKLLREQHGYQEILKQAAREIARIRNLKKLLNLIVHLVAKTVHISHSAIYLFDLESRGFLLKASRNLIKGQPGIINIESSLVKWLENHREPLLYEEIKQKIEINSNSMLKELEEQARFLNASVIVPGFLEGKLLGFLVLGERYLGRMYSQEDLNTFSVLASQAALAIENALLYENIEEQVRQRTEELVEVQKQLIQAEKLATVGTLAGGVAHEINNPLTAVLTNTQMLLADCANLDPDSKESLQLIEEATKRCRTIVQKLMTYAKKPLESAEISRVDLLRVVRNVASFLAFQLEQDNIKISVKPKEGAYFVEGNHNELEQVLTNIVLNARDAIKKAKEKGREIQISLSKNSFWVKIDIQDDGAGIPREIISKIFDPFFTTKDVGKGLGLGLSICQAIIEKHKGLINVKSEPDIGTTFTVQLPGISESSS